MQAQTIDESDDIYKIIVIGDTSTGKTNIIHTFAKDRPPNNVMPTIGVEYTSKTVRTDDGAMARAQIWDTAGQQQYRAVTMTNYRKAVGALIVFDVTNRNTYRHVAQWLQAVRERAEPHVQILLVGHKIDQPRRQVSKDEAEKYAAQQQTSYLESTIKDPSTIKLLFRKLLTNVVAHKKSQVKGMRLVEEPPRSSGCSC